MAKPCYIRQF